MSKDQDFDVIVVGGGHAGCEAAHASAKLGAHTVLITQSVDKIAAMSCNPAIGGTAKGHLVKEIDALGGLMAKAIDITGIQFRTLNRKKGPAIWSSRAQADMTLYARHMKHALENTPKLSLRQDTVTGLIMSGTQVAGVETKIFGPIRAKKVIITTGTFLNGLIHIGNTNQQAGRAGDAPSLSLASFFHKFYSHCKVINNDADLTNARIQLIKAVKTFFRYVSIKKILTTNIKKIDLQNKICHKFAP